MADNVTVNGETYAFDEVDIGGATVKVGRNKIGFGADGVYSEVSDANPLPVIQAGAATSAKQDSTIAAINGLKGPDYETVAASQADQPLGVAGASGDLLVGLLIVPASTSPGAVSVKDGGGTAITLFTGGADSISTLHPFFVPFGALSAAGAWKVTTGANVSAVAVGNFS